MYTGSIRLEDQFDIFVKVIQDGTYLVFIYLGLIYTFYATTVSRNEPESLWEIHNNFCLTTMQFTRISYAHVLSLCVIVRVFCAPYNWSTDYQRRYIDYTLLTQKKSLSNYSNKYHQIFMSNESSC